ncbi:hypothetical protein SDC9_121614 [bioreactor metagenome]|uniref:Uncharacterized protein n=1 Tax=bioreactor metagenome TaxID=1076179 RepID=A0A645CCG9_9ZZZZ
MHGGEMAELPRVVQAVAYDKLVRYRETGIFNIDVLRAALGLVKQYAYFKRLGSALAQELAHIRKRESRVEYILNYYHMFAVYIRAQIFLDLHDAAASGRGAVGGDGEKVKLGVDVRPYLADKVGEEYHSPLEHTDENHLFPAVILAYPCPQLPYLAMKLLFRKHYSAYSVFQIKALPLGR